MYICMTYIHSVHQYKIQNKTYKVTTSWNNYQNFILLASRHFCLIDEITADCSLSVKLYRWPRHSTLERKAAWYAPPLPSILTFLVERRYHPGPCLSWRALDSLEITIMWRWHVVRSGLVWAISCKQDVITLALASHGGLWTPWRSP